MRTQQRRTDSLWKTTCLSILSLGALAWAPMTAQASPSVSRAPGADAASTRRGGALARAPERAEDRRASRHEPSNTPDASPTGANEGAPSAIPKLASSKAQLEHATGLKKAMRGAEGEARDRARKAAIDAYRAVREYFGDDSAACSEAAFRAGDLLRAAEDTAGALAEYTLARDRGTGTEFRVRAMLEIAHLERRAKHMQPALSAYEAVVAEDSATPRQKDEASLWAGRVHADLEHFGDARRVWQRVADKGEDPLDRVRAWDFLVSLLIDQGDLEGAAGVLERCREAMSDVAAEESKLGERVRSALASMRCIEELTRAIDKRRNAGEGTDKNKDGGSKTGKRTSGS